MSKAWEHGNTYRWQRTRRAILAANALEHGGRCQLAVGKWCPKHERKCRNVCTGRAECVHHTRGKEYGDDPKFLVASCAACNGHVGSPSAFEPPPRKVSKW